MDTGQTTQAKDELSLGEGSLIAPFNLTLSLNGLRLIRDKTDTLQVNVGLLCNRACRHCHLDAGPRRSEMMGRNTAKEVLAYARRCRFT